MLQTQNKSPTPGYVPLTSVPCHPYHTTTLWRGCNQGVSTPFRRTAHLRPTLEMALCTGVYGKPPNLTSSENTPPPILKSGYTPAHTHTFLPIQGRGVCKCVNPFQGHYQFCTISVGTKCPHKANSFEAHILKTCSKGGGLQRICQRCHF